MLEKYFGISDRIAKWRYVSEFEMTLADAATDNPEIKRLYALYYKHLQPDYYEKGRKLAEQLIISHPYDFKDMDHETIYHDMVYSLHKYGYRFQDYCIYRFATKPDSERIQFVADKLRYYYCDILNAPEITGLMTNKFTCYQAYKDFFLRDIAKCENEDDLDEFLKFTARHPHFIFKPMADHSGHGITIIHTENINPEEWFRKTIETKPGIVEELIIQGDELNKMNPNAINSCRIVAFSSNGTVTLIGGALRMGCGESVTDNAGSGGIYASIDVENGTIQSDAQNYKNQRYGFHPTTGTAILGFQLPDWEDAKDLIRRMSLHIKGTTLISWDIAYSNKGWLMVEANDNGDWSIIQSNLEKGMKKKLFALMDKHFKTNKKDI